MPGSIHIEHLSKRYLISHGQQRAGSFRELVIGGLRSVFAPGARDGERSEEFWALNDVSFTVTPGERIGIIGRNGAGKSTLLKLLSRITDPTAGRITLDGRVASLLEVGTGFHPELSGRENVYMNGAILGMSRQEIRRKFDEIVAFAEVERFLDVPVKRYSSGMYVRLAFAVAAHLDPDILIVDEVLAVGDAQFQKKCMGKMQQAGTEGRTVIFVSHNMGAVRGLCTRAVLLKGGRLVSDGAVGSVVEHYLAEFRDDVLTKQWAPEAAPRNGTARILGARIVAADGSPATQITSDDGFRIDIDFEVLEAGSHVGFTLVLYDAENNCIFSSIGNHEPNWYGKPMPAGRYQAACAIPQYFLNNGAFYFDLIFYDKGYSDASVVKEVLRFEIEDGAELRKDYFGGIAGAVRPALVWNTQKI